jgi:3-methyladenine DNA glycosylase AlkC
MAELLKHKYPLDMAKKISQMIYAVHPEFNADGFLSHVQQGYEQLELMARARHIAVALKVYLPDDYEQAVAILLASLQSPVEHDQDNSMAAFIFMPHTVFVSENGLQSFDTSMQALYQLTQIFTAEFAIRPFIRAYPEKSLALLRQWAKDSNQHVRRLVSEGTRTRLPWASRLPEFIQDPSPVVALLALLKDDNELYVRRSVANNLNDIGKDHPKLLTKITKNWLVDADKNRQWLVKHALRSAIKRGEQGALNVLGYGAQADVKISQVEITPQQPKVGDSVQINFALCNQANQSCALMVDFAVHFVKANGQANPKVFKLKALELGAKQAHFFSKKVSLKPMTTRTLYAGKHKVSVIINGQARPIGEFLLSL